MLNSNANIVQYSLLRVILQVSNFKLEDRFMHLITSGPTSRRLGVSVTTLHQWHKSGRLVPVAVTSEGHRLYDVDEIDTIASQNKNLKPMATKKILG